MPKVPPHLAYGDDGAGDLIPGLFISIFAKRQSSLEFRLIPFFKNFLGIKIMNKSNHFHFFFTDFFVEN